MAKTVLITGASSGIGKETALYFHSKGWNVVATMRNPDSTDMKRAASLDLIHLDVTNLPSIKKALAYAKEKYKRVDALVNNAGYALMGPFEYYSDEQVRKQFDTNVFGLMAVTKEIIPLFRTQGGGTIINIASMGGRISFPLYSAYNASKWAVEGFSESLMHELAQFNIKVKVIEPGVVMTDFYGRSMVKPAGLESYSKYVEKIAGNMSKAGGSMGPSVVAKTVYAAAMDNGPRLRYTAGRDAQQLTLARKILPESVFFRMLGSILNK